jgi:cyclophilin family peptidyl-prolyl cis-trans isomerase
MKRLFLPIIGCALFVFLSPMFGCHRKTAASVQKTDEIKTETQVENIPVAPVESPIAPPATASTNPLVRISTNYGNMVVMLYNETPQHRDNFLKLVNEGFYNDLLFHRCIKNFMIQGGDPNSRGAQPGQQLGMGGPGYTVPAEFNKEFIHKKGALSAARQGDMVNPERRSSGSQFYVVQGQKLNDAQLAQTEAYINRKTPGFKYTDVQKEIYRTLGGTAQLDMDYTVFGEVIEGINIIDSIAAQPTAPGDRPLKDVIMKMEVIKK